MNTFDNAHRAQAEHDVYQLNIIIGDLLLDWVTPTGHRTLVDSAGDLEEAAEKLSKLLENIHTSSTARVVDLRRFG
jgi:hypothetical protein